MTTSMITKICITFSALAAVAAWAAPGQAACNNGTIQGEYAALANAWIGTTPPFTPFFGLREVSFEGNGVFTSTGYKSTAGTIPAMFSLAGTYTVSADCTMTQTTPGGPTFFGVIAADSNKIYQIRTDAGTETIIFERVVSNQNTQ